MKALAVAASLFLFPGCVRYSWQRPAGMSAIEAQRAHAACLLVVDLNTPPACYGGNSCFAYNIDRGMKMNRVMGECMAASGIELVRDEPAPADDKWSRPVHSVAEVKASRRGAHSDH